MSIEKWIINIYQQELQYQIHRILIMSQYKLIVPSLEK